MDREAWHAAIRGVTKSRTRLSDWTELNWRHLSCLSVCFLMVFFFFFLHYFVYETFHHCLAFERVPKVGCTWSSLTIFFWCSNAVWKSLFPLEASWRRMMLPHLGVLTLGTSIVPSNEKGTGVKEDKPWTVPASRTHRGWLRVVKIVLWGPEWLGSPVAGWHGEALCQVCPFAVITLPREIIHTSKRSRGWG